ncbi:MAG TPA: IS21 family transposase [Pseudomonadales bacterium]|jgi:transposase|nr:IS21 family transposase [Pseudomonadales bacterium]|tara:strand:+ start:299 stop:1804 length:1506 start_codon:yes stop_codon:yes gene_type:complete
MKGWVMIHKIKAMHDEGRGTSINEISRSLRISRNTVRKYLRMDEQAIQEALESPERHKALDHYRSYLRRLLTRYPGLKAPKVYRKLQAKVPDLEVSERTLRRYLNRLRQLVAAAQQRYYEPVIDEVPAVQCQVDAGELRDVEIGGLRKTIYFLVFVLSYSRLMYVSLSNRPIDTEYFIQMHDEAFRYFGGMPEECVYDQTKLVVIEEMFREVTFNERFHRYASQIGLDIRVCEGYDPESKGKVEAGVKYVKGDCLYGDRFTDWSGVVQHVRSWLSDVANVRIHGTTRQVPQVVYDTRERDLMNLYVMVDMPAEQTSRKADKTGLISFRANKYSVPQAYQQNTVLVEVHDGQLLVLDVLGENEIARHTIVLAKGHLIKNRDHYRDASVRIADYECNIRSLVGDSAGRQLCQLIRQTSPKIYRDQLAGVIQIIGKLDVVDEELIARVVDRPRLTATQLKEYVEAYEKNPDGLSRDEGEHRPAPAGLLKQYAALATRRDGEVAL